MKYAPVLVNMIQTFFFVGGGGGGFCNPFLFVQGLVGDLSWNDPQSRGTPTNVSYGELFPLK
jgi:hypothetical protein